MDLRKKELIDRNSLQNANQTRTPKQTRREPSQESDCQDRAAFIALTANQSR